MPNETTCPVCRQPLPAAAAGKGRCPGCQDGPGRWRRYLKVTLIAVFLTVTMGAAGVIGLIESCPLCGPLIRIDRPLPKSPSILDEPEEKQDGSNPVPPGGQQAPRP